MDIRRDVFQAIADPTRRAIIHLLADKAQNVNAISENFPVSRQAVSLHLKILSECGLVLIKKQGREMHCEARLDGLREVSGWLEQYRKFYEQKLDSLESYLNKLQTTTKKNEKRKRK